MHLLLSRSRKFIFLHSNPPYDTETYTVLKKMLSPGYMKVLEELVSFLMLVGLFEGGLAYWVLEQLYLWTFEISTRQQRSKNRLVEDEARAKEPDWENPHVVGRNRRKAHAPLRSFPDIVTSVSYWTTRFQHTHHGGSDEGHMHPWPCEQVVMGGTCKIFRRLRSSVEASRQCMCPRQLFTTRH